MRLDAAIRDAADRLSEVSSSARLDAELLLCQVLTESRSYLFAHPDDELDTSSLEQFQALLLRRLDGEPVAYIAGKREFWSRELRVSPATLVPRPETELLVELTLQIVPPDAAWDVLDLGTGSGAIAVTIAAERPGCNVVATDISEAALSIAADNAHRAGTDNVSCVAGDWTLPVGGRRFHVIVSNPPYIRDDDAALTALRYEPRSALAAGADGLRDLRRLAGECPAIVHPGGRLLLEHGLDQAEAVALILEEAGWSEIAVHKDLEDRPRVTVARWDGK